MFGVTPGRKRGPLGPMPTNPWDISTLEDPSEEDMPIEAPTPSFSPGPAPPPAPILNPPRLARAELGAQPISPELREMKDRYEEATAPPSLKQKLLHLAIGLGPMALGGIVGGIPGAAMGAAIGGGVAHGEATSAATRNAKLLDQINRGESQQEREFEADNQYRQHSEDRAAHSTDELRMDQRHQETLDALGKGRTVNVDGPNGPEVRQFNPDTGRYDIPVGGAPSKTSVLRHPVTQEPIGIQRGSKPITDPKQMTPEEQALLKADHTAYDTGLKRQDDREQSRNDRQDKRDAARDAAAETRAGRAQQAGGLKIVNTKYDQALDASTRRATMEQNFIKGEAGDAQADMSMLMNHLGMTGGAQKGFRMTEAEIQAAVHARGLPDDFTVFWKRLANGERLSSAQRKQMLDLGKEKEAELWQTADNAADLFGVDKPKGRGKVGSGTLYDQMNAPKTNIPRYDPKTRTIR